MGRCWALLSNPTLLPYRCHRDRGRVAAGAALDSSGANEYLHFLPPLWRLIQPRSHRTAPQRSALPRPALPGGDWPEHRHGRSPIY